MRETCELSWPRARMLLDGLAPAFSTQLQPLVPKRMLDEVERDLLWLQLYLGSPQGARHVLEKQEGAAASTQS